MQDQVQRPWLRLYRGVDPELKPAAETALDMFRSTLERNGSAPLVHYFDSSLSAAECAAMSDALAVELQQRGVEVGDRVAVYLQNIPQVVIAVLAIWKCGAVVVPCNPMLRDRELGKILRSSGCLAMICQEDLYADVAKAALPATAVRHTITTSPLDFLGTGKPLPAMLAGVTRNAHPDAQDMLEVIARHKGERPQPVELTGDDVAFMVHTSGTTGDAKGAMNTHRNVVFATSVYEAWIGLTSDDVILGLAPLFHVTGLIGHVTLAMLTGSPLVLFYRFDVNEACRLAASHRATFTVSAITAYIALLNSDALAKYDLKRLTKLYTGGAPTPASVLEDWHGRTGVRIQPMYGLTEATSPTHMTPHGAIPPIDPQTGAMAIGVPVCNTQVKVITDAGFEAGPREIGEFVIAGPQIVPGYWQKPDETAKALTADGLRTGDVGFMDENGWFYLVDRSKDMIVASGFKVWPREVEEVLYQHPAVREAAVVGVPDAYRGETIKAVISLKPGQKVTPDEIRAFARERMAAYKYPRVVEIIDELPKTTSGKIMRRLLQPTAHATMLPVQAEIADVSYPQLRAALEARAVLEAGAVWLRMSRGTLPVATTANLYEKLRLMLAQLRDGRTFVDRAAFLAANDAYHMAVVDLAENEHLSVGFRRLRLRDLLAAALKSTDVIAENGVYFHEYLTDSLAANDARNAIKAIVSWSKHSSTGVRRALDLHGEVATQRDELRPGGIVEDLSIGVAKEQDSLAGDVDALVMALDARAALEIGITQSLGTALSIEAERDALVARLRAFTPLVRGTSPSHIARYLRADDAFHRIFLSLLRNQPLFDIYNAMDVPELMRRVLVVAPISIREIFDDHKALTNALRAGSADDTCAAITEHANRVRAALASFLADSTKATNQQVA
ncbi:MAG TPA: AMP-binding protein [Gammaproteobacteria bacterium]